MAHILASLVLGCFLMDQLLIKTIHLLNKVNTGNNVLELNLNKCRIAKTAVHAMKKLRLNHRHNFNVRVFANAMDSFNKEIGTLTLKMECLIILVQLV